MCHYASFDNYYKMSLPGDSTHDSSLHGPSIVRQPIASKRSPPQPHQAGHRRPPSPLDSIQPDHWRPVYTSDLIDLLHVLGRLIALEPAQADLLNRICEGDLRSDQVLKAASAFAEQEIAGARKGKEQNKQYPAQWDAVISRGLSRAVWRFQATLA
jgi:hypothetical protein